MYHGWDEWAQYFLSFPQPKILTADSESGCPSWGHVLTCWPAVEHFDWQSSLDCMHWSRWESPQKKTEALLPAQGRMEVSQEEATADDTTEISDLGDS